MGTGLKMNIPFAFMSLVMLAVMAVSMWKDTHPEWMVYQDRFEKIERRILLAQRNDLARRLQHPDYHGDYLKAQKRYLDSKAASDSASGALEETEANLEELDLQQKLQDGGGSEEGAAESGGGQGAKGSTQTSKDELAALDQEFKDAGGNKPSPTQTSKDELAALDQEFKDAGGNKPSPTQTSKDELAALDQEFKDAGGNKPSPTQTSEDELAALDQEFKDTGGKKPAAAPAEGAPEAATPEVPATFEEADFTIDVKGAEARLDAAEHDLLAAESRHTKEMIGLPKEEELKRQIADTLLKEAQQGVAVAKAGLELESRKADVKNAALVAKWALDAKELQAGKGSGRAPEDPQRTRQLEESKRNLEGHVSLLRRDLRLVDSRLERNRSGKREIDQIYVDRLGAVDRCTTCHLAVEDPAFKDAPQPFRAHPGKMLQLHAVEKFGCASCHGGWGDALDLKAAHGELVGKGKPLMIGVQAQASCGKCHGESKQLVGAGTYLAGAELFRNSGCLGCHKVESVDPPAKTGPSLDRVSEKINPEWLVGWLKNPRSHTPLARMPNFGLDDGQARAIAAYLFSQRGSAPPKVPPFVPSLAPDSGQAGQHLAQSLGCLGCHSIRGEGGTVGPELTNIRNKVRPDWLSAWLHNPKAYLPQGRMPVIGLSQEENLSISNYLLSLAPPKPDSPDLLAWLNDRALAKEGSKLIVNRGCAGCHDIKGFERIAAPELTHIGDNSADLLEFGHAKGVGRNLNAWISAKLRDPKSFDTSQFHAQMPKFGFDEKEIQSLAVYLMSLTSQELPSEYTKGIRDLDMPLVAGRRVFADHSCSACHRLSGVGAKIGPELTREGEKVKPAWLFEFLKQPVRLRWWQKARMPNFHLSDKDATILTEYLMALSNQPEPYDYTPPERKVYPLADVGAKLFVEMKCQSCHPLAGKQAVAGGDTAKLGPDLGMAPMRLKSEWMFRFFKDPQGFDPGTQMPTFKRPDRVFRAVIDFLMKPHSP